jgi:hypothetical protein
VALELPPIGEAEMFLAPKAKPPQPKIGNKALADVKVKVKNKAKAKVKVETPVETPVENKSPIAVKASYEADSPIEFHGRPLVVPASRYITSAHMSNHKFYDAGANGQFVFLDGGFDLAGFVGESSKGLEQSKANIQAFNQEFQDILDEVTWATHVEPGISRENMPLEESTADGFDKRPAIVFVFERGWEGDIELGSDPDHPGWGVPVGWYRIDGPPEYIAAGKAGAFPESVQDQIEEGIGAEGFTDFYEASKYVNGRVNIRLVPVAPTEVDVDRILKRAPRLTLKRK